MFSNQRRKKRYNQGEPTNLLIRHWSFGADVANGEWFEAGEVLKLKTQVDAIDQMLTRVKNSSDSACYADKRGYRLTMCGKEVWKVIRNMPLAPESLLEGRRLSPELLELMPFLRRWEARLRWWTNGVGGLDLSDDYPRKVINRALHLIRRLVSHPKVKEEAKKRLRRSKERYASCINYILKLFEFCPKFLVLRVDLYYEGECRLTSLSPEARKCVNDFFRDLSEGRIVPGIVGYIDVAEDGLERRIHHHLLVLCDGHDHQSGFRFSQSIGEYWEACVGSPRLASFKNCWTRRREYPYNCLGLVHYADSRMLMGLREAVEYMCKDDGHTFLTGAYGKALRKGQAPRVAAESRRGAPRKGDLTVARTVLLTEADPVPEHLRIPKGHVW